MYREVMSKLCYVTEGLKKEITQDIQFYMLFNCFHQFVISFLHDTII